MAENITKIKVGNDVRCLSLDTQVIDTTTLGRDSIGRLGVKLGSSMEAIGGGLGVKLDTASANYLQRGGNGLQLNLPNLKRDIFSKTNLAVSLGSNTLVVDPEERGELFLGTGLKGDVDGKTLCLSLGSGLEFDGYENRFQLNVDEGQSLLALMPDGTLSFNLERLYSLLETRYNLTKK